MILYATEHFVEGPSLDGINNSVEMAEFRHQNVYRPGSPNYAVVARIDVDESSMTVVEGSTTPLSSSGSTSVAASPWVELYDNSYGWKSQRVRLTFLGFSAGVPRVEWSFDGSVDPNDSVMIDFVDYDKDDYNDFGKLDDEDPDNGFHDQASSIRWWAPPGCNIFVTEHDHFGGKFLMLTTHFFPSVAGLPDLGSGLPFMCDNQDQCTIIPGLIPNNFFMCDHNEENCIFANDEASSVLASAQFFNDKCSGFVLPPPSYLWSTDTPPQVGLLTNTTSPTAFFQAIDNHSDSREFEVVRLQVCFGSACDIDSIKLQVLNVAPQFGNILLESEINENGTAHLMVPFT
ncbi:MAG: hypothetical protein L0Y56_21220, partial [Nitrospira sp.]|nr:hypothetical protein [Nitrospira sp.]